VPCASSKCFDLQAAVDEVAKTNKVSNAPLKTITVHGRCVGRPVLVNVLFNVVITGVPPANGCPVDARTAGLTSTIKRMEPPFSLRKPSNGEVIKVYKGANVTVQYLNIRDGRAMDLSNDDNHDDGLDYKRTADGLILCNCITNNEEGIDVDNGSCNQILRNFVTSNEDGLRASGGAKRNTYKFNYVSNFGLVPTEPASDPAGRHNGIAITESSTLNNFEMNTVTTDPGAAKADDGIQLFGATNNCLVNNTITNNGGAPVVDDSFGTGACEVHSSTNNRIDCNTMTGNVAQDMTTPSNVCRIVAGSSGNTGSNVPGGAACSSASCPAQTSCTARQLRRARRMARRVRLHPQPLP